MMMQLATSSFDEESSTGAEDTPMAKEPLSPPSGAESLFLAGLMTSKLSAAAVSDQIKINHSSTRKRLQSNDSRSVISGRSSDDFWSCAENPSDFDDLDKSSDDPISQLHLPFTQISEEGEQQQQQKQKPTGKEPNTVGTFFNDIMSTFYSNSKYDSTPTASPAKMPPKPATPATTTTSSSSSTPDLSKIDAAEIAYAKAKDVWAWGKTVPLVSIFVGTTETVASKALDVAGTSFSSLDGKIAEELAKLDSGILNPAIETIAKAVISAAAHSEEHLKPIILSILSTVGMIKSEANETTPEAHTSTPEVTTK